MRSAPIFRSGLVGSGTVTGLIVVLSLVGCRSSGPDLTAAEEVVRPRLAHFEAVERWARRTMSAAHMRPPAAVEETLVAPYRRDRELLGFWVHRIAPLETELSMERDCSTLPPPSDFFYLRDLDVDWAAHRCSDTEAVLLSRTRESPGGEIRVTVAYERSAPQ